MLELTVLAVPDCPNEPLLLERLDQALSDHPDACVARRVVRDEADAARLGMHGSPTLLINGTDPFAAPGTPASMTCRIYQDPPARPGCAPSVAALRLALLQPTAPPTQPAPPTSVTRAGL